MGSTVDFEVAGDRRRSGASTGREFAELGWLRWFAVAVIIGMQAGTLFEPLGTVGETRVADWIDLVTPFAVIGSAVLAVQSCRSRLTWSVFVVGGVAFSLGHGLHLAANSVSNVADKRVADADIVHLWDEVASHYIWYAGLYVVLVAMGLALRDASFRLTIGGYTLATLFAITLVNTYIEGDVAWMGLVFLATGPVAARRWWPGPTARLVGWIGGVGLILLLTWGIAWYVADGTVFPEFTDVGWI